MTNCEKTKTRKTTSEATRRALILLPSIELAYNVTKLVNYTNQKLLSSKTNLSFIYNNLIPFAIFLSLFYIWFALIIYKTPIGDKIQGASTLLMLLYSSTLNLAVVVLLELIKCVCDWINSFHSWVKMPIIIISQIQAPNIFTTFISNSLVFITALFFFSYLIVFLTSDDVIGWIKKTFAREDVQLGIVVATFTAITTALISLLK